MKSTALDLEDSNVTKARCLMFSHTDNSLDYGGSLLWSMDSMDGTWCIFIPDKWEVFAKLLLPT